MEERPNQRDVCSDVLQLRESNGQIAGGCSPGKGCKSEMSLHLHWSLALEQTE